MSPIRVTNTCDIVPHPVLTATLRSLTGTLRSLTATHAPSMASRSRSIGSVSRDVATHTVATAALPRPTARVSLSMASRPRAARHAKAIGDDHSPSRDDHSLHGDHASRVRRDAQPLHHHAIAAGRHESTKGRDATRERAHASRAGASHSHARRHARANGRHHATMRGHG